jgi:probable phosphoglycerate mutase
VTVLNTEERREGKAYFRMATFGDTSHLYAAGEEPSFAARFCETYNDVDQRHD